MVRRSSSRRSRIRSLGSPDHQELACPAQHCQPAEPADTESTPSCKLQVQYNNTVHTFTKLNYLERIKELPICKAQNKEMLSCICLDCLKCQSK